MRRDRQCDTHLPGKRGSRRSVVGLVLLAFVALSSVGSVSAKAQASILVATKLSSKLPNSSSSPLMIQRVVPSQLLCDRSSLLGARIQRQSFATACPSGWRSADLNLVMCTKGDLYQGQIYTKVCPSGWLTVTLNSGFPAMKCEIGVRTLWLCDSPTRIQASNSTSPAPTTTIRPTATSTTVAGKPTTQSFAGEYCGGKLSKLKDAELTNVFSKDGGGIVGLTEGKVPDWENVNRCRSAEILHRLSPLWRLKDGEDVSNKNKCTPRPKEEPFFPANTEKGWFFSKLVPKDPTADDGKCQGIERLVKNCPKAKEEWQSDLILKGDQTELLKLECTYSPDGRLVVENIAPIWEVTNEAQLLKHSPGIEVTAKSNTLKGHQVALPANGCLTMKKKLSECKPNAGFLKLTPRQKNIINKANGLLGAIYGKTPGLAGIEKDWKLGVQTVTFDCVSLAKAVGAKGATGTARQIFDKSVDFDWGSLDKTMWTKLRTDLPIGSLISTDNHVTVVVGYLERADSGFSPIVVEAENNLSGVVRAKVEDTSNFGKRGVRVFKGG